jgi:hypothetical protein
MKKAASSKGGLHFCHGIAVLWHSKDYASRHQICLGGVPALPS